MHTSMGVRLEALTTRMEMRDQKVPKELAIYKVAASTKVMASHEAPKVEVSKPQGFSHDSSVAREMTRS